VPAFAAPIARPFGGIPRTRAAPSSASVIETPSKPSSRRSSVVAIRRDQPAALTGS